MSEQIHLTIDDTASVSRIRWRVARSGSWPAENTLEHPLGSVLIDRPPLTDIELEVTCGRRGAPLSGTPLRRHWHPADRDGGGAHTTHYVLAATSPAASLPR